MAFEIMDCGQNRVSWLFVGADCIAMVPDHLEHLKRNHDFVVFNEVSDEEQDSLGCHGCFLVVKVVLHRFRGEAGLCHRLNALF